MVAIKLSFKNEIKEVNTAIFTLQDVHFEQKGQSKKAYYEIFESLRKKAKGGTAIGVHKALEPVLIQE